MPGASVLRAAYTPEFLQGVLLLGEEGFLYVAPGGGDPSHLDFRRNPFGFGNTQLKNDRCETVTYSIDSNRWSGRARHVDQKGREWYRSSEYRGDTASIIEQLKANRAVAPSTESPLAPYGTW